MNWITAKRKNRKDAWLPEDFRDRKTISVVEAALEGAAALDGAEELLKEIKEEMPFKFADKFREVEKKITRSRQLQNVTGVLIDNVLYELGEQDMEEPS